MFAVPSSAVREVAAKLKGQISDTAKLVSAVKGLERESYKPMSEVIADELENSARVSVMAGPMFAVEILRELPTAVTVASKKEERAEEAGRVFHHKNFRVYTSSDIIGVEYGGVFKNVMAIAAGMVDGLEMGYNARAALITRGLAEMKRLVGALGGKSETVSGLSGLGDLLLTATSDLSRNRRVGKALGRGETLEDILENLGQVAEGVKSAEITLALAERYKLEAPITQEVARVLRGECSAKDAAMALISRAPRSEHSL